LELVFDLVYIVRFLKTNSRRVWFEEANGVWRAGNGPGGGGDSSGAGACVVLDTETQSEVDSSVSIGRIVSGAGVVALPERR